MSKKFDSIKSFKAYQSPEKNVQYRILVGMGSCGIAAGANKVFKVIENEINKRGLKNIEILPVGCLGLCFSEPNVEVIVPDLPDILYGKVDEKFAERIIEQHVLHKNIINENIFDKPIIDVLKDE